MKRSNPLAALVLALVATGAVAEVYKWVDEQGKVHYGDRRPGADSDPSLIELPAAPSRDADHDERSLRRQRLLDAFEVERDERRRAEAESAAARQERNRKCAQVRSELAKLERANIVYTRDEGGARIYMSDEERDEVAARGRAWIDKHCD
jgi:hypothetical protein